MSADKKLDLIAQLLAKAESTTAAEAEALTEHAERLMIKYGIEQAMIDERRAHNAAPEKVVEVRMTFRGIYSHDLVDLAFAVVDGLGALRLIQSKHRDRATVWVIGFESDARQAELLIRSLEVQAAVAMRAWWAGQRERFSNDHGWTETERRRMRSDFLRGFGSGAGARIRRNRRQAVSEAGSGTDIVLRSRAARVDDAFAEMYPNMKTAKPRRDPEYGFHHGATAGEQANTGERQVTHGKALTR